MKIIISGKNVNISSHLKETVEKKLGKLDKYFSDDVEAHVMVSPIKDKQKLEATINVKGTIFRAEETAEVAYDTLERIVDKLSAQMSKYKTKLQKKHKDNKAVMFAEIPDGDEVEDGLNVAKRKEITLSPMSAEEAVMQMELLGHTFFVFIDDQTELTSIVYSRNHGDYGVIQVVR